MQYNPKIHEKIIIYKNLIYVLIYFLNYWSNKSLFNKCISGIFQIVIIKKKRYNFYIYIIIQNNNIIMMNITKNKLSIYYKFNFYR